MTNEEMIKQLMEVSLKSQEAIEQLSSICYNQTNTFIEEIRNLVAQRDEITKQNAELIVQNRMLIEKMSANEQRCDKFMQLLDKAIASGTISVSQH